MKMIKAALTLVNGDLEENALCKVDYAKQIVVLYEESGDRKGFIPLSSVLKFEFKGYYDPENSDSDSSVDEGW